MPQVLIVNTPGLQNRGGMAVIMASLRCLREAMPDTRITVLCHHCKEDWPTLVKICQMHNVQIRKHPWYKEHNSRLIALVHSAVPAALFVLECSLGRIAARFGFRKGLFQHHDVILDLNIDALHDHYGVFFPSWALANIMLGKIAGRPVVVWSAGIGSFQKKPTTVMAKFVLNRVDVILLREKVSFEYLKRLRISRPRIHVTADHAFLLEPAPQTRVDQIMASEGIDRGRGPLVAICASALIHRYAFPDVANKDDKYWKYIDVMSKATDYLVTKLDATVVFIPHTIIPSEDDRVISARIHERVQVRDRVQVLKGEYLADELKGIIGRSDMLIGARMHSTIASTSMGVPTIAVVYGEKSHGIIGEMMGQADYIVEIAKCSPDQLLVELKSKIDAAWANRVAIRSDLASRSQEVRGRGLLNYTIVRDLLRSGAPGGLNP